MPLIIKNKIDGKVIQDHTALEKILSLDEFGNKLINCNKPTTDADKTAFIRPGIWLALWMGNTWVKDLTQDTLGTFLHRALALQLWEKSPFDLGDTVEVRTARVGGLQEHLVGWLDKKWTMHTNQSSAEDTIKAIESMLEEYKEEKNSEGDKKLREAISEIRRGAEKNKKQLTKEEEDELFAIKNGSTYREFKKIRQQLKKLLGDYYDSKEDQKEV